MSVPELPSAFVPSISHGGYGFKGATGVVRSSTAGGRGRYAGMWEKGTRMFSVSFFLRDPLHVMLWDGFYTSTIKNGALAFSMPLDSGMGVLPHTVNMIPDSYSQSFQDAGIATVSFSVEAEPSIYSYSGNGMQSITDLINAYGDQAYDMVNRLHILANVESNVLNF